MGHLTTQPEPGLTVYRTSKHVSVEAKRSYRYSRARSRRNGVQDELASDTKHTCKTRREEKLSQTMASGSKKEKSGNDCDKRKPHQSAGSAIGAAKPKSFTSCSETLRHSCTTNTQGGHEAGRKPHFSLTITCHRNGL